MVVDFIASHTAPDNKQWLLYKPQCNLQLRFRFQEIQKNLQFHDICSTIFHCVEIFIGLRGQLRKLVCELRFRTSTSWGKTYLLVYIASYLQRIYLGTSNCQCEHAPLSVAVQVSIILGASPDSLSLGPRHFIVLMIIACYWSWARHRTRACNASAACLIVWSRYMGTTNPENSPSLCFAIVLIHVPLGVQHCWTVSHCNWHVP